MAIPERELGKRQDTPMELDLNYQNRLAKRARLAATKTLDKAVKNPPTGQIEALKFSYAYLHYELEFLQTQRRIAMVLPDPQRDEVNLGSFAKIGVALIDARNGRYVGMKACIEDKVIDWADRFDSVNNEEYERICYGYINALTQGYELLPESGRPFLIDLPLANEDIQFKLDDGELVFKAN